MHQHAGLRIVLRFCCVRQGLRGSDVLFGFGRAEAYQAIGTSDFWVNHSNRPLHSRTYRPGAEGVPRRPGIHLSVE